MAAGDFGDNIIAPKDKSADAGDKNENDGEYYDGNNTAGFGLWLLFFFLSFGLLTGSSRFVEL